MNKMRGLFTTEFMLILVLIVLSFVLEWQKLCAVGTVIAVYIAARTHYKTDSGVKNYTIRR